MLAKAGRFFGRGLFNDPQLVVRRRQLRSAVHGLVQVRVGPTNKVAACMGAPRTKAKIAHKHKEAFLCTDPHISPPISRAFSESQSCNSYVVLYCKVFW
jgi:hypothetical protein